MIKKAPLLKYFFVFFPFLMAFVAPAYANNAEAFLQRSVNNVFLHARMSAQGPFIQRGLIWRIYAVPEASADDKLILIKTLSSAEPRFGLKPGTYFVCVSFGRAAATKRITVVPNHVSEQTIVLNAGVLSVSAKLDGGKIDAKNVHFSIYKGLTNNPDDGLILPNVKMDTLVRLTAGTYRVIGHYGDANAVKHINVTIQAGAVTQALIKYQAAVATFKLAHKAGGTALADTHWSVMDEDGATIFKTVGAFVSTILAKGHYTVVAENKDKSYHKDFSINSGENQQIEVLTISEETDESEDYSID